jgi:carbonic anhydrase
LFSVILTAGRFWRRCNRSIIDEISPAVGPLQKIHDEQGTTLPVVDAVRSNIRLAIDNIRSVSEILSPMISSREVVVVGGYYSLKEGVVDFFEGVPRDWQ